MNKVYLSAKLIFFLRKVNVYSSKRHDCYQPGFNLLLIKFQCSINYFSFLLG